jgi:hypothetical protein
VRSPLTVCCLHISDAVTGKYVGYVMQLASQLRDCSRA